MNEAASLFEIAAVAKIMLVERGFPKLEKCGAKGVVGRWKGGAQLEKT